MLSEVLINTILISFPLLIYLIYTSYTRIHNEKEKNLILSAALISSIYLCLKFGDVESNSKVLLFCNIPILIAYMKGRQKTAIILSLTVALYCEYVMDYDILFLVLKYISYGVIHILLYKTKRYNNSFIEIIAVLQGFFIAFEYFFKFNNASDIYGIIELFAVVLSFYIISFVILLLFEEANKISKLHLTTKELEQEKQIKTSLFKVTHEVKNPIAVCKGYIDMFDVKDIKKSEKYISIIKDELNRTLNIMNDFLELSHIKIEKEILDLGMLVEETCASMSILTRSKKIKITTRQLEEDVYIEGDYNRLKQVMVNIIKNSIESIEKEGKIEIEVIPGEAHNIIEIRDNGCGMDNKTLHNVKELFFTTKEGGTGLGTALSNEIIKSHGGTINYSSEKDKGTKVIISLPGTI